MHAAVAQYPSGERHVETSREISVFVQPAPVLRHGLVARVRHKWRHWVRIHARRRWLLHFVEFVYVSILVVWQLALGR